MTMNSARGVYQMFGVFHKGELESVDETLELARHSAGAIHSKTINGKTVEIIPNNVYIKPVFVLEADFNTHFLIGAQRQLEEAVKQYRHEENIENAMIAEVVETKGVMPANHWHPRHEAFLRMQALKKVVETLEENSKEKFFKGA